MGLEQFESSTSTSKSRSKSKSTSKSQWYICLWNGKETLSEGYEEITITDKQLWNDIIEFIESNFDLTKDQLMDLSKPNRYEIVKNTRKRLMDTESVKQELIEECFVCGHEFEFPHNWDFIEFKSKPSCPSHTMGELQSKHEEVEEWV